MAAAPAEGKTLISVPPIEVQTVDVYVVGTSPLVMNRWSEKAKTMMRNKQQGVAQQKREHKNPEEDFENAIHKMPDGRIGFPTIGFKAAAVTACTSAGGVKKTQARQAFHINGDLAEIVGSEPEMREDMVRLHGMTADMRYRPQFSPWFTRLSISYNTRALSLAEIVNLLNLAGFGVGVGEWRPEKDGGMGRFRVATEDEAGEIQRLLKANRPRKVMARKVAAE
jgi:hypothetical protein